MKSFKSLTLLIAIVTLGFTEIAVADRIKDLTEVGGV